jgi:hypothetical protein
VKRIKGDARGELAEGRFWDPGMGCAAPAGSAGEHDGFPGEGWSDRRELFGPGHENYYGYHPGEDAADDGPEQGRAPRLPKSISGRY